MHFITKYFVSKKIFLSHYNITNNLYTNSQTCETLQWGKYHNHKSLCVEIFLWIKKSVDKGHLITGWVSFVMPSFVYPSALCTRK